METNYVIFYQILAIVISNCYCGGGMILLRHSRGQKSLNNDLASESNDRSLKIWKRTKGIYEMDKHPGNSLALLKNKFRAIVDEKKIYIINSIEEWIERILDGHSDWIWCLAVLQNGDLATILKNGDLASGSGDKTIKIWNKNNFNLKNTLNGHSNDILCLAVLKNGDLASGSQDETIRIWNTNSGILRITIYAEKVVFSLLIERENLIAGYNQGPPDIYNINKGTRKKLV
ncbi:vegetative incompatibility WD repeat [Brachionus plicatilis]|uniref:Vegetative incompatibility WD repeat n=1 Tax=Brachionus plicatilis TaxID=10195 RepID=A0A3M7RCY7_BRAPC|nr:vegetative incompatibility WD repeat [Brachionus plicatilis]